MIRDCLRKKQAQNRLSAILAAIAQADDKQINLCIQAIVRRYALLYPDWDILFLSIPKEPEARREQLQIMLCQLNDNNTL